MREYKILIPRSYPFPNSKQQLVLTQSVLEVFLKFRQKENEPEAGGLLFAEFDFPSIRIVEASLPHETDGRWRTLFIPNRALQRRLIKTRFNMGRHFIGEWHTHPEPNPTPSQLDLRSMADAYVRSQHELNHFIMIIVGNDTKALNLWVSQHDTLNHRRLYEA